MRVHTLSGNRFDVAWVLGLFMTLVPLQSCATGVFADDFESGLTSWERRPNFPTGAITVPDPVRSSNKVLAFRGVIGGGDVFSRPIRFLPGYVYTISFEYLGLPTEGSPQTNFGGFIGLFEKIDGPHTWLYGTCCNTVFPELIDDGKWRKYTYQLRAPITFVELGGSTGYTARLSFQDFIEPAGDAFFDNISITKTPIPAPGGAIPYSSIQQ